jgi:hypothetical protein
MVSAAEASLNRLAKSLSPEFGAEIALAQYRQDQAAISDTREPGKSRAQVPGNGKEART